MAQRDTVLLLIPHLGGGGAERVVAHLARSLSPEQFEVHLGIVTPGDFPVGQFPPHVRVHEIGARRVLFGIAGLVRLVRTVKPDLILSGMFHLNLLVLLLRSFFPRATRILVRQNGMFSNGRACASRFTQFLYRRAYQQADGIICQTRAMANELTHSLGSTAKVHVLRNPVDTQWVRKVTEQTSSIRWAGPGPNLLAVGRLSSEKGFDLLLEAFVAVKTEYPSARLTIFGQGKENAFLRAMSVALGVGTSVRFEGYVAEPESWFPGATLLVIPSRVDAFPNVLLEAAAAGLPVVMTPCSAGITEVTRGQAGIWLARTISSEALALSLNAALATLQPRERFRHPWLAPFELREAVGQYESLIHQTIGGISKPARIAPVAPGQRWPV